MTAITHIAPDALGLAALSPQSLERRAAEVHVRVCPDCSRAWHQAERLIEMLDHEIQSARPLPQVFAKSLGRLRRIVALRTVAPATLAALVLAIVIAVGGAFPGEGARWVAAALLSGTGAVMTSLVLNTRGVRWSVMAAAGLSVLFASAFAGAGPVAPLLGIRCAAVELVPVASGIAALIVSGRGLAVRDRWRAVALVAACGLVSQGALIVSCPARMGAVHVLLFHSGGLLAACAAAAWFVPALALRRFSPRG